MMASAASVADAGPPPVVKNHDPLPESSWFWRRVLVFGLCTIGVIGIWIMVQTMVNLASNQPTLIVGAFVKIIGWLLVLVWFAMTYYLIAPSAEQVVKMVNLAGMLKGGASWITTATAAGSDGGQATTTVHVVGAPQGVPASSKTVMGVDLNKVNDAPLIRDLPWNKGAS
jgi:hypothetical protein